MNSLRTYHTLRSLVIVAMLLGWMALSQRCAFAQILKAKQAAAVQHECCERKSPQPSQPPADGRSAECCQALSVVVPDAAKVPATSITESLLLPVEWTVAALGARMTQTALEAETSPPQELLAFTELVLHRSLRSHAPPLHA